MKQKIYQFTTSATWYWLIATFAFQFLEIPEKVVEIAVFIPPVLGFMWGLPAALGVYVGALLVPTELNGVLNTGDWLSYFMQGVWIFLAGYLPCFIWRKFFEEQPLSLDVLTLRKFLASMFITFVVTSVVRGLTANEVELEAVAELTGTGKTSVLGAYMLTCFINDFFIAIFFDLAWFFFLVNRNFHFYIYNHRQEVTPDDKSNDKAWHVSLGFYMLFPISAIFLDKFQVYGLDNLSTWMHLVAECLTLVDAYLVLMLYLLMCYQNSIMLEVVFLVTQTVFLTAAVLGFGSSVAIGDMVNTHADESLRAMSIICRERLYRTFFSVRQAVNGMKLQAINDIESYERIAEDTEYRKNYLEKMKKDFSFGAVGIDGSISYYLRFIPEIEGTKGGFSMQRKDAHWEGALSPFVERETIDLAPYSPDDTQKVGWYYLPLLNRSATWIEPYVDAVTGFYVISYVAPLFLDGKFIGVVGMDIDFNYIIQELRRMSIYDYGYVYIMDRNNVVLYHRDQPQGSQFRPNPDFKEIEVYLANGMWLGIATPLSKVHDDRNRILMHLITSIIVVAMLISVISITLASRAIRPLAGITAAAKLIASGDLNVKISYESSNEIGILVRSIHEMAARLEVHVYRDRLTGLRNMAAYTSKASELEAQSRLFPNLSYGVVIFDVNFLKKVNDKYGHAAGNELLHHAAKVIREVFGNNMVYRVGGDEFAAILEGHDYERRQELLDLFDEKLAKERFNAAGDTLTVSIARGIGIYEQGMNFSTVSKNADSAMYKHKLEIKSKAGEDVR